MKNSFLTIETLRSEDVDSLQPLVKEFVQTHQSLRFRENHWSAFRDWFLKGLNNANFLCLLAKMDGEIVGFIVGDIRDNVPLLSPDKVGHVSVLVIDNSARTRGIGGSLWENMRSWFTSKGVDYFELYTEHGNKLSGPFWNKRGFQVFLEKRRLF
jgi:ribosomal protein S18 acetylase RimI-like enzyme